MYLVARGGEMEVVVIGATDQVPGLQQVHAQVKLLGTRTYDRKRQLNHRHF